MKRLIYAFSLIMLFMIVSCDKKDDIDPIGAGLDSISITDVETDAATINWLGDVDADVIICLAEDEAFTKPVTAYKDIAVNSSIKRLKFENIKPNTKYFVRIHAVGYKEYKIIDFTTKIEMPTYTVTDIGTDKATINWLVEDDVDVLVTLAEDEAFTQPVAAYMEYKVNLSVKLLKFESLKPNTKYFIRINILDYDEYTKLDFTTKIEMPTYIVTENTYKSFIINFIKKSTTLKYIHLADNNEFTGTIITYDTALTDNHKFDELIPNTDYFFRFTENENAVTPGEVSATYSTKTSVMPTAIITVEGNAVHKMIVDITFNDTSGLTKIVEYAYDDTFTNILPAVNAGVAKEYYIALVAKTYIRAKYEYTLGGVKYYSEYSTPVSLERIAGFIGYLEVDGNDEPIIFDKVGYLSGYDIFRLKIYLKDEILAVVINIAEFNYYHIAEYIIKDGINVEIEEVKLNSEYITKTSAILKDVTDYNIIYRGEKMKRPTNYVSIESMLEPEAFKWVYSDLPGECSLKFRVLMMTDAYIIAILENATTEYTAGKIPDEAGEIKSIFGFVRINAGETIIFDK
jgi:hypothetical protein